MNYIDLINNFWEMDAEIHFSDKEISLYFHLLNICNRLTWKNPFGQSNAMMIARFGWGKSSFDSAKKKLKDAGLIDFKPGDGRGNVYTYWIRGVKVTKKVPLKRTLSPPLSDTLSDTLSGLKPATSIDLNKYLNSDATASASESLPAGDALPSTGEKDTVKAIVDFYHEHCKGLNRVKVITDKRRQAIMARYREQGAEAIRTMLLNAGNSNFLAGQNKRGWSADFDWLFRPGNFIKIYEGKYANKTATTHSVGTDGVSANEQRYGSTAGVKRSITDRITRLSGQTQRSVPCGGQPDCGAVGRLPGGEKEEP